MIHGLGCDIVQISRFAKDERFLQKFMNKYFTLNEINEIKQKKKLENIEELRTAVATRFAAKEAAVKALGTGFQNGITLKDIEVTHDSLGKPEITLYNKALTLVYQIAQGRQINLHLTLSNEKEYANAVVVLEVL